MCHEVMQGPRLLLFYYRATSSILPFLHGLRRCNPTYLPEDGGGGGVGIVLKVTSAHMPLHRTWLHLCAGEAKKCGFQSG